MKLSRFLLFGLSFPLLLRAETPGGAKASLLASDPKGPLEAAFSCLDSFGGRTSVGRNRGTRLSSLEFFGTGPTWKSWTIKSGLTADLRLEGALGLLGEDDDESFLVRIGPQLDLTFGDSPLHFVLGTSVAFLADRRFGRLDLGSHYQFISSAGFDWDVSGDWFVGYRWQHISNGGLTDVNPGLNLNTISLGFRF